MELEKPSLRKWCLIWQLTSCKKLWVVWVDIVERKIFPYRVNGIVQRSCGRGIMAYLRNLKKASAA